MAAQDTLNPTQFERYATIGRVPSEDWKEDPNAVTWRWKIGQERPTAQLRLALEYPGSR